MLIVGLTGGLGAGKTTLARMFAELGAKVIDVDKMAHELLAPGTREHRLLVDEFGCEILNGKTEINRSKLADLAFRSPSALRRLNEIVHPELLRQLRQLIEEARGKSQGVLVVDAALLFEWNLDALFDVLLDVEASPAVRLSRAKENGLDDVDGLKRRMKAQLSSAERMRRADLIIYNEGGTDQLSLKAKKMWQNLEKQFAKRKA